MYLPPESTEAYLHALERAKSYSNILLRRVLMLVELRDVTASAFRGNV